jgi:hypothetical protein
MGYYYTFYNPDNMEIIDEGKFIGMPFFWNKLPCEIPMFPCHIDKHGLNECYDMVGLLTRRMAEKLQVVMEINETLFTDMMDENHVDLLIFTIT